MVLKNLYYLYKGIIFRLFEEPGIRETQMRLISQIRRRGHANVVFFASNLPQWEYQGLYELLNSDSRFHVEIVVAGFKNNTDEQNDAWISPLITFFEKKGIDFNLASDEGFEQWLHDFDPDLLFYPQPYDNIYTSEISANRFYDKLIAYTPYCLWDTNTRYGFNEDFHNHAWRLYYANNCVAELGKKLSYSKGRGIVVTGYPKADLFLDKQRIVFNPWKKQDVVKKKIVWAPHYSISSNNVMANQSNFLDIADAMVELCQKYKNSAQFALKPHPRLYRELCQIKEWGKERTERYFEVWEKGDNMQLEQGDYIDLFISSDALVHDSGSFTSEYFYTQKPAMFITKDVNKHKQGLNKATCEAIDCHYLGKDIADIDSFIDMVVNNKKDSLLMKRTSFFQRNLLPPGKRTVAENMYNDIVDSIFA